MESSDMMEQTGIEQVSVSVIEVPSLSLIQQTGETEFSGNIDVSQWANGSYTLVISTQDVLGNQMTFPAVPFHVANGNPTTSTEILNDADPGTRVAVGGPTFDGTVHAQLTVQPFNQAPVQRAFNR